MRDFLLFPSVMNLDDLTRRGLYLSDIPLHDATRDLVLLGEQFREEYKLTQELEILTDRLQHTLRALEDEKKKTDRLDSPLKISKKDESCLIQHQHCTNYKYISRNDLVEHGFFFFQKVFQALICSCLKWVKVRLWPHQRWYTVFPWFNSASAAVYHPFAVSLVSSFYDGSGVSRRFAVSFLRYTSSRVCSQGNRLKRGNLYHLQYFFSFYIFRKKMLVLLDNNTRGINVYIFDFKIHI